MFKFGTIGAFKQVRNNPRCKATKELRNGNVVIPNDATGLAPTPVNATEAQGDIWVAWNIIDKPEIRNSADFVIATGEEVRAFSLVDLKDLPVELNYQVISGDYTAIARGDKLTAATDGSGAWVKTADVTGYKVYLEVLDKTSFGEKGLYCVVRVA